MAQIEFVNPFENNSKDDNKSTGSKKGIKSLLKNKKFLILVAIVSIIGLYVGLKKSQQVESEASSVIIPTGYTGYPGAGSSESSDYVKEDVMTTVNEVITKNNDTIVDTINKAVSGVTQANQNSINALQGALDSTNNAVTEQIEKVTTMVQDNRTTIEKQSEEVAKQRAIDQMMANSDKYHYAETTAEKNALHEANKQIAAQYGFTFNDDDGYYYDSDGKRVYQTATQKAKEEVNTASTVKKSSTGSSGSSSSSSSSSSSNKSKNIQVGSKVDGKTVASVTTSGGTTSYWDKNNNLITQSK